jgi:hypothetical protein
MRALLVILFAIPAPAFAQDDYQKLMRGYVHTFRLLGKSQLCGLNFETEPFFREVAARHGADSEPLRVARLAFTAGAENLMLPLSIDPAPPAPMPCDVVALMRGGMTLPELPKSLAK